MAPAIAGDLGRRGGAIRSSDRQRSNLCLFGRFGSPVLAVGDGGLDGQALAFLGATGATAARAGLQIWKRGG